MHAIELRTTLQFELSEVKDTVIFYYSVISYRAKRCESFVDTMKTKLPQS